MKERYGHDHGAAGPQHPRDLPHRGVGGFHVLEHLDAHDPVGALAPEGEPADVGNDVGALEGIDVHP